MIKNIYHHYYRIEKLLNINSSFITTPFNEMVHCLGGTWSGYGILDNNLDQIFNNKIDEWHIDFLNCKIKEKLFDLLG